MQTVNFDSFGYAGLLLDYMVIIFFSAGALLLFFYFWYKGRLNFDEAPKFQMLQEDHPDDHRSA